MEAWKIKERRKGREKAIVRGRRTAQREESEKGNEPQ
jgi:hypothetical protein